MKLSGVLAALVLLTGNAAAWTLAWESDIQEGAGWITFSLSDVPQDTFIFVGAEAGAPWTAAVHVFDQDAQPSDVIIGHWSGSGYRVMITDERQGIALDARDAPTWPGGPMFGIQTSQHHDILHVATWAAGMEVRWNVLVTAPATAPHDILTGDDAYWFEGGEWGGTAAHAQVRGAAAGAGALMHRTLETDGRLIGSFGTHGIGASAGLLTLANDTTTRLCPCDFVDIIGEDAVMPGTYDLQMSGASARSNGAVFAGADVHIAGLTD